MYLLCTYICSIIYTVYVSLYSMLLLKRCGWLFLCVCDTHCERSVCVSSFVGRCVMESRRAGWSNTWPDVTRSASGSAWPVYSDSTPVHLVQSPLPAVATCGEFLTVLPLKLLLGSVYGHGTTQSSLRDSLLSYHFLLVQLHLLDIHYSNTCSLTVAY